MIECKLHAVKDYITFKCPRCGHSDIVYMSVPQHCFKCHGEYTLDILALVFGEVYRISYFTGNRKWGKDLD